MNTFYKPLSGREVNPPRFLRKMEFDLSELEFQLIWQFFGNFYFHSYLQSEIIRFEPTLKKILVFLVKILLKTIIKRCDGN